MAGAGAQEQSISLSVAMIVCNEADAIAETIKSVRAIADEVVVLDTGSDDGTVEIAEGLGARVISSPWSDDFSAARNHLVSHCRGRWIFWLDAGECLLGETAPLLSRCVRQEATKDKVYYALLDVPPMQASSFSANASHEQIAQPRLMPNRPEIRFEGCVGETLLGSVGRASLELGTAPAVIRCRKGYHDADRKKLNAQRDLCLLDKEKSRLVGNEDSRRLIVRGEALSTLGRHEEAKAVFRQAAGCAEKGSAEMLSAYYGLLTSHDGEADAPKIQLEICMEALDEFPLDAQLLCALGNYLQAQGQIELAARAFENAVEHGQIDIRVWHLAEIIEIATACWVAALQIQGNNGRAVEVLQAAVVRHPRSQRLRRRLIELYAKRAEAEKALAQLEGLNLDEVSKGSFAAAIRGSCDAASGKWTSALAYLQSAYVAGCQEPLCLRWLAVTLISNGQAEDAKPILDKWQLLEPENIEPRKYLEAIEKQMVSASSVSTIDAESAQGFSQENVEETPVHSAERWHRVDSGAKGLDTGCPQMPIINQASTADGRY